MKQCSFTEAEMAAVRLLARHTGAELTNKDIKKSLLPESLHRQAHAEGMANRAAGLKCLCRFCEVDAQRIANNETLRCQYMRRRAAELDAQGFSQEAARILINDEIGRGAALRGTSHEESKA